MTNNTDFVEELRLREAAPQLTQSWPSPQDYNESVQNPQTSFFDEELCTSRSELNGLGLPKADSGNFASVYHFHHSESEWALRCFLHPPTDQRQRYDAISKKFAHLQAPYFANFHFIEQGIRVNNQWYPIMKMEWVNGKPLLQYIQTHLHDASALGRLADSFKLIMLDLHKHDIAHGDLQHGNIIVETHGKIRLVDYDACFVPELTGKKSSELGHCNYQHPDRSLLDFDETLDNFSAWIIWISLLLLAEDPSLWTLLDAGNDCLLFKKSDLIHPKSSKVFHHLESHDNEKIRLHARYLRSLLNLNTSEIPPLSVEVVEPSNLEPLEAVAKNIHSNKHSHLDYIDSLDLEGESGFNNSNNVNTQSLTAPALGQNNSPALRTIKRSVPNAVSVFAILVAVLSFLYMLAFVFTLNSVHTWTKEAALRESISRIRPSSPKAQTSKNWEELMKLATDAYNRQDYQESEEQLKSAVTFLGPLNSDLRMARTLSGLAEIYRVQGKYFEAEDLLKKSLSINESVLGSKDNEVTQNLNSLALLYKTQGNLEKAEKYFNDAINSVEGNLVSQDELRAQSLNGLAELLKEKGDNSNAEKLFKRALLIRQNLPAPAPRELAESLSNLASVYSSTGQYKKAEPLQKKAVHLLETKFGEQNVHLANALNNLGGLYLVQGKYKDAIQQYKRSLDITEKMLGSNNVAVADGLSGLASVYCSTEKYAQAVPLLLRSLEIREKIFGKKSVYYAESLNKFAELYRKQEKFDKAESLYTEALEIYKNSRDDKGVAAVLNNTGMLHLSKGENLEAEKLFRQARKINEQKFGTSHPIVMTNLNNLATSLQAQGKYSEAEPLYKQALKMRENAFGKNHLAVAQTLRNLATLYTLQGKLDAAEKLNKRALTIKTNAAKFQ